jgi:hypothetical protein
LIATGGATADSGVDVRTESYGTFNTVNIQEEQWWNLNSDSTTRPNSPPLITESKPKFLTYRVNMLIVALGVFCYHSMTYDHLLPIFLQDERMNRVHGLASSPFDIPGGLGLSIQQVGLIMSVNGLIALFIQAIIFPLFVEWLGVWKVFVMVTILHPIEYFIVPFIALLPEGLVFPGIYGCLTIRNFLSILAYPVLLILLKQACPAPSGLGMINGLAASAGAASRTVAPPVAGYLYGIGIDVGFTGLAWWCSALVAGMGALQLLLMNREKSQNVTATSAIPCMQSTKGEPKPEVHIVVTAAEDV